MDDLNEVKLTNEQTNVVCQGLMDLAAVDGVDPSETALIENFYASEGGNPSDLEALLKKPFDLAAAKTVLDTAEVRHAFLQTCYMLIYADGVHSEPEKKRIHEFAAALDVNDAILDELHLKARMFLLCGMAQNIRNRDAVIAVGNSMGLNEAQMSGLMEK